jgi:murein DD-endopeptidase MepM/ murein hydrolase activator NlpD
VNGNYNITGVLPGNHKVYVSASGYYDYVGDAVVQANAQTLKDIALKPVPVDGYRLPFPGGTTYKLTNTKHDSGYAQDWGMPIGRDVAASRAGKVIQVKESSNAGGCSNFYLGKENYVTLLHADGKKTLYVHLLHNSVSVRVGDYVRSGQAIGKSDSTGKSCGAHLHFAQMFNGKRIVPYYLDVSGGVPKVGSSYTSGNYLTALVLAVLNAASPLTDTVPPEGGIHFRLTGQPTYTVQIEAFDYESDFVQARLASTEAELQSAAWFTVTDRVDWTMPIVWGQLKDEVGNLSAVYSDTIEAINYEPVQAAFAISPTVCIGAEPQIENVTTPFCEQCGWNWDFGNGISSQTAIPAWPYPEVGYLDTGP